MTPAPSVSVLVTALGAADGLAATLDSALAQQGLPPDAIELVVVVDDGPARTVAAGYAKLQPARVRVLDAPAAPPDEARLAASVHALAQARGELLAPLEPGDRWPVARLAAQVAELAAHPQVGLVYSELLWQEGEPPSGKPVARLLRELPCIAPSSIMLRAALVPALGPLPAELPRLPWWLVVRAACVSEIAWVPAGHAPVDVPTAAAGAGGAAVADEDGADATAREQALREALAVQRGVLREAGPESPFADALGEIWKAFVANARRLLSAAGGDPFTALVTVTDADRAAARETLAEARDALARGDGWPAAALAVRAAALDPWCAVARTLIEETHAARPRRGAGDPLAGARRFITLAFAEELLAHPELLAAYAARFDGGLDATLAIDASGMLPTTAGQALGELVAELGLDGEGTAHLIAVLGPIDASVRAQLPGRADALLTCGAARESVPAFDAEAIDALHALARRAPAA